MVKAPFMSQLQWYSHAIDHRLIKLGLDRC